MISDIRINELNDEIVKQLLVLAANNETAAVYTLRTILATMLHQGTCTPEEFTELGESLRRAFGHESRRLALQYLAHARQKP